MQFNLKKQLCQVILHDIMFGMAVLVVSLELLSIQGLTLLDFFS